VPEAFPGQSGHAATTVRLAIYARVSTADQQCEMQLRDLRQYAAARGWNVAGEYVDTGRSGKNADRPSLKRCVAAAKTRKFDAIAVWKLDRWGRTVQQLVNDIIDFDSAGIRFIAITQGIDTDASNPKSRLLVHVMAAFSRGASSSNTSSRASAMRRQTERGPVRLSAGQSAYSIAENFWRCVRRD